MRTESFVMEVIFHSELIFLHSNMCKPLYYYVITVFITGKQTWCALYNGIWTPEWVLRACLFYRAFPHALSLPLSLALPLCVLRLCLSASLAHWVKAGVYRNSRQAGPCHTAEQHRNVLYALERQGSWDEIVHQVPQTRSAGAETNYVRCPVNRQSKRSIAVCVTCRTGWKLCRLVL